MKSIELVTHCYATELPHYASALKYQLSSLIINKPKHCKVLITICCEPNDEKTLEIIPFFQEVLSIWTLIMENENQLGRRSIGRNIAAKVTKADIVWFTDVDYLFSGDCLEKLSTIEWPDDASMIFPPDAMICKDHAMGDRLLNYAANRVCVLDVDPNCFIPNHYRRAIGGIQIVQGDFAREHGYLDGIEKWQTPVAKPFGDFHDDIAYRKYCKQFGKIVPVDLPGIKRLRHSTTTYQ